jgi:putative protease
MELVCPAGNLPALKAAVDNGADCVYAGLRNQTNARNFNGLNFDDASLQEGIAYARRRKVKVFLAINTYPKDDARETWTRSVDRAAAMGVDAIICADPGLMAYARRAHPGLRLHLSVQASATNHEAINFYRDHFDIQRAVLPRVLALPQVGHLIARTPVEIEVFGFGGLCVMVEGRCALSGYATGVSPNCDGACSPAKSVRWGFGPAGMETRLNDILIDRFAAGERAGYPTICKGRYEVGGQTYYAIEEPASLNTLELLPRFLELGVKAVKIEGRQRGPAYVGQVARVWRAAIDACRRAPQSYRVQARWMAELQAVSEGQSATLGAYHRPWK